MSEFPIGIIQAVNFRPTPILSDELAILMVGHEILRSNPSDTTMDFNLDIRSQNGELLHLSKIVLQGIFESLEVRKTSGRNDVEHDCFAAVQFPQVIQILLLPCRHVLAVQIEQMLPWIISHDFETADSSRKPVLFTVLSRRNRFALLTGVLFRLTILFDR